MKYKHRYIELLYFTNNLKFTKNILKFKRIAIVYSVDKVHLKESCLTDVSKFCIKHKINLYIKDNFRLAIKIKAQGVFLSATNKRAIISPFYNDKFSIIGSAHNQMEYYFKKQQKCSLITLSPIFYNKKYSSNKILGATKFNLISNNWKTELCALGGINKTNLKKIKLTRATIIGCQRLVENNL
jgi:thiamine-phosphate pyrophosphorylase